MTDEDQLRTRIHTDPGFVHAQRFGNSLAQVEERYPDGCPDNVIAKMLMISEAEVRVVRDGIVLKMRALMGVDV
jgi:hypothetical protein